MTAVPPSRILLPPATLSDAGHCRHCGSDLPDGGVTDFCCHGCEAAFAVIQGLGLDRFYAKRSLDRTGRPLKPDGEPLPDFSRYILHDATKDQSTLHLMIDGLQCAACVWLTESVLAQDPRILDGRVNMTTRRLRLRWQGPPTDAHQHVKRLTQLGFRLMPFDAAKLASTTLREERALLRSIAVAGFAAGNVMLLSVSVWAGENGMGSATRDLMHWISALIAMPTIAFAGRPFFRSAGQALRHGRTNMDVPISIGLILTTAMSLFQTWHSQQDSYFDSVVTLLFFLLIGRYLDLRARGKARAAAEHLLTLQDSEVQVVEADGVARTRRSDLVKVGDIVLVGAGERIGVDGRVSAGVSEVDASLVTGESLPQPVQIGDPLFSGMINLAMPLQVETTAAGEATLLASIVRLMEAAEHSKAKPAILADRIAGFYAPTVHALALVTFLVWSVGLGIGWQRSLLNAVSVLIITCPCALALAIPAVQVVACGRLLRQGILLKSPNALDRLAGIDIMLFDKTGTLTLGQPRLAHQSPPAPATLILAARLATASRHPLAQALCRAAGPVPPATGVIEHPGQGLSWASPEGDVRLGSRAFLALDGLPDRLAGPEIWLAAPGHPVTQFAFADPLRRDSAEIISKLQRDGVALELLSGDRPATVAAVARAVGIAHWRAAVSPIGKAARLEALRAQGHRVAMVGDGLNDAPALAAADISLSPSSAVDVVQTAADIVFQGDALAPVAEALTVARAARQIVRQNLGIALLYNLCAVPLAVTGHVTPLLAAIAMSGSSILVVGNALRLSRRRTA